MGFDYREILRREMPATDEELKLMRRLRADGLTHREIGKRLGRDRSTIGKRLREDNGTPNRYMQNEIDLMLEMFGRGMMPSQIAQHLPRHSAHSISAKLRELGCRSRPTQWSEHEKEIMVRMLSRGKTYAEIGAKLGRSPLGVERQNQRRRARMKTDKQFQAAAKVLEFCLDPVKVLRAVRDSQIVPHLLDEDVTDDEIAQLVMTARKGW